MNEDNYNDEEEIKKYVIKNYKKLFNETEMFGFNAMVALEKAKLAGDYMKEKLNSEWSKVNNPKVNEVLGDGIDIFIDNVYKRLITEHGNNIFLNICPECSKIARTPKAKQCPWCFHDWH